MIKNQLLHVYAKNYEGNGKVLLIRMVRYTLDGMSRRSLVELHVTHLLFARSDSGTSCVPCVHGCQQEDRERGDLSCPHACDRGLQVVVCIPPMFSG